MRRKILSTHNAPEAIGPYSQAVEAGNLIFLSGQVPLDPKTGDIVGTSIEEQTRQVLDNIQSILSARGLGMGNMLCSTVYLRSMDDFPRFNQVYASYFDEPFPARVTIGVNELPRGARVEISCIAATSL